MGTLWRQSTGKVAIRFSTLCNRLHQFYHNTLIDHCFSSENTRELKNSLLEWYYDENRIFPIAAILKHEQVHVACVRRKMLFIIVKSVFSFQRYINNSLHLARKYARTFLCGRYSVPSSKQFSESIARRKTVSYEEQIMSKDKYPSIFSP